MKKQFIIFLFFFAAFSGTAFAEIIEHVQIGDLYYNLDTNNHTAEVTCMSYSSYNYQGLTSISIPQSIKYNNKNYQVVSIGNSAFNRCLELTSITIPNSITHIGQEAFCYCRKLPSVIIPNSVTELGWGIFYECNSLTSITIPEGITSIRGAFIYCTSLMSIEIPLSVINVDGAFNGCSNLTTIVLPENITHIGESTFRECSKLASLTLPRNIASIGDYAFYGCTNLTSLEIPDYVSNIGNYAFCNCSGMTFIVIGEEVKEIGENSFMYCENLSSILWKSKNYSGRTNKNSHPFKTVKDQITSFSFGVSVEYIPSYLCEGMKNIYSITIPDGVVDIGESVFLNCSMLRQIKLPSTLKHIGAWAFDGTFYSNKEANWEDHGLYIDKYLLSVSPYYNSSYYSPAKLYIKEGTYLVADSAAESARVYELDIPSSLKIIGAGAFANNYTDYYGIHELNLPSTLEYIGERAFAGNKIFSIKVPSSINYIGADAFKGVTNILYNGSLLDAPWGASFLNAYEESGILYESKARKEILTSHDFKGSRLVIPNSVTKIHKKAFNENSYIHSVILGANIEEIESKAFYCYYLDTIYSFLKEPIAIPNDAFGWIDYPNTLLYVSQDQLEDYYRADVWREFDIVPIIADVVSTEEDISISTTESEAIIVVELIDGATIYELTVSLLDSTLVATFTYNSSGELINTVFNAPSRFPKEAYQFIVSGLDSGTTYIYSMVAKDENGNTIKTKEGTFNTIALHGIENINVTDLENSRKLSRDGQIFILRGEHTYTVTGQQVK